MMLMVHLAFEIIDLKLTGNTYTHYTLHNIIKTFLFCNDITMDRRNRGKPRYPLLPLKQTMDFWFHNPGATLKALTISSDWSWINF